MRAHSIATGSMKNQYYCMTDVSYYLPVVCFVAMLVLVGDFHCHAFSTTTTVHNHGHFNTPTLQPHLFANRNIPLPVLHSSVTNTDEDDSVVVTTSGSNDSKKTKEELYVAMSQCLLTLNDAANTKQVDADQVYEAMVTLEQLARQCNKIVVDDDTNDDNTTRNEYAQRIRDNLTGSWRLIFTTGTVKTQQNWLGGQKINYFPIKAVQTFDTTTNVITNAIYIGDFVVLQFLGTFSFDLRKCQLQFDFDTIQLFQGTFSIPLQRGQAAELGAKSGLGSESNVVNIQQKNRKAFFNWISADDQIATARGGGGGLALWKRI